MRANKTQKGFTIIETLIVVAISGAMLLATALLVAGQISRYQFRESSTNVEQQIADTINDVRSGYFTPAVDAPAACGGNSSKAGDSDCVYAGKLISVDGSNRQISRTSIYMAEDVNPLTDPAATNEISSDLIETEELPSGLDYDDSIEFYILFTKYSDTFDPENRGQSQSVALFVKDGSGAFIKPTDSLELNARNGARTALYCIGKNGDPNVYKILDKDEDCA